MSTRLPDEILKEILSPILQVSDGAFRDISAPTSPFCRYSESTSTILVVCKSWLRVTTPLLYNVVVLRSKAQAQALARTLRGNKLLGTFVRKLRVEGGFGAVMASVLQMSPNISDLWLTFNLWSSDNVAGLCRGLPKLDPRRVIICIREDFPKENASVRQLADTLSTCIKTWKNMDTLTLPYSNGDIAHPCDRDRGILQALRRAPNLKTLILQNPQISVTALRVVTKNPLLQRVCVVRRNDGYKALESSLQRDTLLKKLVRFEDPRSDLEDSLADPIRLPSSPALALDPSFVALQSTPDEIKDILFSLVICFSLTRDPHEVVQTPRRAALRDDDLIGFVAEDGDKMVRKNILLVSKRFRKLALQHLYRHTIIETRLQLKHLTNHMKEDPSLGAYVLSLVIDPVGHHQLTDRVLSSHLPKILPYLHRLQRLSAGWPWHVAVDFHVIETLATVASRSLLILDGLTIGTKGSFGIATPLYAFTSLRSLEWNSHMTLRFKDAEVPPGALANLEILSYASNDDSFIRLLRCMELPALRQVTLSYEAARMVATNKFLGIHGAKLETFTANSASGHWFALCPALSVLHLSDIPSSFEPHATLTKIVLTDVTTYSRGEKYKSKFKELGEVDFGGRYPALQEIQAHQCEWPTTEREISNTQKANWIKFSEHLSRWNIKLTDGEGRHWRPRLK